MISCTEFLEKLFPVQDDEDVCISLRTEGGTWINYNESAGLDQIERKEGCWHYCVATTDGVTRLKDGTPSSAPRAMVRRTRSTIQRAYVVVCDDIGEKARPPGVEPTYKLESSAGSYHWGYAIEPVVLDGSGVLYYESCVRAIIEAGHSDPGAGGAYRCVKLPGAVNNKPGREGFRAELVEWHPERRWNLDDLMTAMGLEPVEPEHGEVDRVGHAPVDLADLDGYVDPVLAWLTSEGLVVDASGEWVTFICPWGDEDGCHTTGPEAGYKPLGRGESPWMRGFNCFHGHTSRHSTDDFLAWVAAAGGPEVMQNASCELLLGKYCLMGGREVHQLHATPRDGAPRYHKLGAFKNMHKLIVGVRPTGAHMYLCDAWLEHPDLVKPVGNTYKPGEERLLQEPEGQVLNTWLPPDHPSLPAAGGEFEEHVREILPHGGDAERFFDWLAYKVQYPAKRSYAVVMVADTPRGNTYGIGRSMTGDVIRRVLQQGVHTLGLKDILGVGSQGQYNSWAADAQVIIVEETKEEIGDWRSNSDHFEQLKTLIDPREHTKILVKQKYGAIWESELFANFLFFTNHMDALRLPEGDRRFDVMKNTTEKRPKEAYARLAAFISSDAAIAGLYAWLMQRDVSQFDAWNPPESEAKNRMIELSQTEPEVLVDVVMRSLKGDLVTQEILRSRLFLIAENEYSDTRTIAVAERMLANEWRRLDKLKPDDIRGGRIRGKSVRILRNVAVWTLGKGDRATKEHARELEQNAGPMDDNVTPLF